MPFFIECSVENQIKIAIERNDPQLLQLVLGSKHCQLWQHWVLHAMILYQCFDLLERIHTRLSLPLLQIQISLLTRQEKRIAHWMTYLKNPDSQANPPARPLDGRELKVSLLEEYKSILAIKQEQILKTPLLSSIICLSMRLYQRITQSIRLRYQSWTLTRMRNIPLPPLLPFLGIQALINRELSQECDILLTGIKSVLSGQVLDHTNWGTWLNHHWQSKTDFLSPNSMTRKLLQMVSLRTSDKAQMGVQAFLITFDKISQFLAEQEANCNNLDSIQCVQDLKGKTTKLLQVLTQQEARYDAESDRLKRHCQSVESPIGSLRQVAIKPGNL